MGDHLSDSDRAQYVSESGGFCPHCKAEEVHEDIPRMDADQIVRASHCHACGARWYAVYNLTDVHEICGPQDSSHLDRKTCGC